MKPGDALNRVAADLHLNGLADALRTVDKQLKGLDAKREQLTADKARILAKMARLRGGRGRAADILGVSWTQVTRSIGDHTARVARRALREWPAGEYTLAVKNDTVIIGLDLDLAGPGITAVKAANGLVSDLNRAGLSVTGDGQGLDTNGRGPCAALARGDYITVTISTEE